MSTWDGEPTYSQAPGRMFRQLRDALVTKKVRVMENAEISRYLANWGTITATLANYAQRKQGYSHERRQARYSADPQRCLRMEPWRDMA
jgi:hypothetical protein